MDKTILQEYIDACELIRETEEDIRKLRRKKQTVVQTHVKGSNPVFPYQEQHFCVEGTALTYAEDSRLRMEEKLLEERRARAEQVKYQVEEWMLSIPMRMQRIIRFKIFQGMTWEEVAIKLGRRVTADSARMEFERFYRNT